MNDNIGLRVHRVSRHFKGLSAVDDVSFTLRPGEILALIGPNGAGKSTLLQLISGVDRISGGSIFLNGTRIDRLGPSYVARLGIGRTFQTSRVFPMLTVAESVGMGAQAAMLSVRPGGRMVGACFELLANAFSLSSWKKRLARREAVVKDALNLFGDRLSSKRAGYAYSLSYANRRRLETARVLAGKPQYLLLDEPTAGMNPTETAELAALLLQLRQIQPELAVMVVEHKLSFVRSVADRIIVLNHGRILTQGEPNAVLDSEKVVEAYLGRSGNTLREAEAHLG
jgi:branched-chain amino acid transport system ATP-binding protein